MNVFANICDKTEYLYYVVLENCNGLSVRGHYGIFRRQPYFTFLDILINYRGVNVSIL